MSAAPRLMKAAPQAALHAACAPEAWRKGLERARERATGLERACAWLETDLPAEPPRLRPRPLLGDCLAELAAELGEEIEAPAESESRQPSRRAAPPERSRKPAPAGPPRRKPPVPHEARSKKAAARPGGKSQTPPPSGSKKAGRGLLERLAGTGARRPRVPLHKAADHPRSAPTPAGAPSHPTRRPLPPVAAGGHDPWGRRASARLNVPAAARPLPAASTAAPPAGGAVRPEALEAQWRRPLSGETFPLDRLEALAREPQPAPAVESRRGHEPVSQAGLPSPAERAIEAALSQAAPSGNGRDRRPPAEAQPAGRSPAETAAEAAAPAALPHDPGESLAGPSPRFAPPQAAPTLPDLRPAQRPSANLTPAAAFAAERSARREALDTEPDDLDALARKLRRILEEEARRHGIDV